MDFTKQHKVHVMYFIKINYKYTKTHWIVNFGWILWYYKLYLDITIFKKER